MTKSERSRLLFDEHEGGGLTFDELGKLEKLNTALEEQWSRMEAVWDEEMVSVEDE